VSGGSDGIVRLWNLAGEELHALDHNEQSIWQLSFRPDAKMLVSVSAQGTAKLWNLDLEDLIQRGCTWVQDYLATNPTELEELKICQ
jgi:WD40 repeat protein